MDKNQNKTKQVKQSNLGHRNGSSVEDMINRYLDTKLHNEYKEYDCCICGRKFTGYGNNPYPVSNNGRCCNTCDAECVIPVRMYIDNYKHKVSITNKKS